VGLLIVATSDWERIHAKDAEALLASDMTEAEGSVTPAELSTSYSHAGFATLRARLGMTVTPDAIAYVTGGLAVGELMTAGTVFGFNGDGNPVNTIVSSHNTKAGWTLGGGKRHGL
jgi:opacity protein-like surface antigen